MGVLEPADEGAEPGPAAAAAEFCLSCASLCRCLSFRRALKGSGLLNLRPESITGVFSGSISVFSLIPIVWGADGAGGGSISDELRMELEDALVGLIEADEAKIGEAEADDATEAEDETEAAEA